MIPLQRQLSTYYQESFWAYTRGLIFAFAGTNLRLQHSAVEASSRLGSSNIGSVARASIA